MFARYWVVVFSESAGVNVFQTGSPNFRCHFIEERQFNLDSLPASLARFTHAPINMASNPSSAYGNALFKAFAFQRKDM